jgi:hypothetical protein
MSHSMQTAVYRAGFSSVTPPRPTRHALLNLHSAFSMQETPLPDFVPGSYVIHLESNGPNPFI